MKRTSKIVMVLAVLVAGSMIASAVLVDYLSDEVEAEIKVSSPMKVGVSEGWLNGCWATTECWRADPGEYVLSFPEGIVQGVGYISYWTEDDWAESSITLDGICGGETITLYVRSVNLADAEITGFEEAIVTNLEGVTSADFVSVKTRTDSIYGDLGYGTEHDLIALGEGVGYTELGKNRIQFGSPGASTWGAGETDVTMITVTFKAAAYGTYTFTYQIVPEIV